MEINLIKGDITKSKADAIVNAANSSLLGGGGVDGAIHKAGGKEVLEDCIKIRNAQGGCKVGEAVYTTAGNLNAQYVIHTVGPRWNGGKLGEVDKLQSCYLNILEIAESLQLASIAIPNISTGIYRFPKEKAAQIAIETVKGFQFKHLKLIQFVCFDDENYNIYNEYLQK